MNTVYQVSPTSIEIVLHDLIGVLNINLGIAYPNKNPKECNDMIEINVWSRNEVLDNVSAFWATTPPHMTATSTTLANGVNLDTSFDSLGAFLVKDKLRRTEYHRYEM